MGDQPGIADEVQSDVHAALRKERIKKNPAVMMGMKCGDAGRQQQEEALSMSQMTLVDNGQPTMSSREIADLVESRHDNVKRAIERLVERGVIVQPPMEDEQWPDDLGRYRVTSVYRIGKRDSYVIVAQLSPEFTARLVDRWQELETGGIPKTFAQALRLAAEQQEQIESQQRIIEQQKPAVQFLENYVEARSTKSLREVAKVLNVKEREFIAMLEREQILFRQSGSLLPFAEYQHRGLFEVKTGEANGHAFHQTRFTPEGIAWIAKRIGATA